MSKNSGGADVLARACITVTVGTQPWPARPNGGHRDQVIYYQYKADRARRTLRGIDEQVKKAEQAVAGQGPGQAATGSSSCPAAPGRSTGKLEDKARALAGLKGYITNARGPSRTAPRSRQSS